MPTRVSLLRFLFVPLLGGALTTFAAEENIGGLIGGPKNPGQIAYADAIKRGIDGKTPVPGIPEPVLLWPNGAPEAKPDANGVFTDEDKPALYVFPAPANNNTGASMLILPGGGFTNRVMDTEGVQIAKFLNKHGIAGFVLRYRLRPNYPGSVPMMDAHRAMRHIRANAATYKVSPEKIGVIGFSAGGELQGDAFYNGVLKGDPNAADPLDRISTHANFSVLIYGGRNVRDPASAPPTFIFNTVDDGSSPQAPGPRAAVVSVMNSLRGAGVPVEAHFYQDGPHGTTMSPGDPQLGQWPELMIKWLKVGGYLADKKPAATKK
ncbi:MAG: alpha/beta hydrolase [Opitutaceae bacterium]